MVPPTSVKPARNKGRNAALWLIGLVVLTLSVAAITLQKPGGFYPEVIVEADNSVQVGLLLQRFSNRAQCDLAMRAVAQTMQNFCPECTVVQARCLETLNPRQQLLLSGESIDIPIMRIPNGVLIFESPDPEIATATCRDSARQAGGTSKCLIPVSANITTALAAVSHTQLDFTPSPKSLLLLPLLAALVSTLVCGLIIGSERWHARFSHDAVESGPQKFHATPVPRIGGIAIASAIVAVIAWLDAGELLSKNASEGFALLALAALPAFAGGLAEDLTKKVGVLARLLLTMTAGVLASVLIGATLTRLDLPGMDNLLQHWPLLAIAFTAFAVGGVANAVNIIDGYNGLAAGYAIVALAALGWVSMQVGDQVVLLASLAMMGGMFGFLLWNWPGGRIFLGDGGAYLLGFWLAELGVLLVVRNPEVSPWLPLVIMVYPIWETLFSMYRRKIVRQHQVGRPDAMHLHQLVYQLLVRHRHDYASFGRHKLNSRVAPLLLIPVTLLMLPAVFLWQKTTALMIAAVVFCVAYGLVYRRLSRRKNPGTGPNSAMP